MKDFGITQVPSSDFIHFAMHFIHFFYFIRTLYISQYRVTRTANEMRTLRNMQQLKDIVGVERLEFRSVKLTITVSNFASFLMNWPKIQ